MEHLPEHCQGCWYFLYKMGSCPYPDVSLVYSFLSTLPYLAAFAIGGLALLQRRLSMFVSFFIVASCYILTDAYLKNIFIGSSGLIADPRPIGACKKSFGMPSSHMVVTAILATLMTLRNSKDVYIGIAISLLQGLARYQLRYHTVPQIVAGWLLGVIYCLIVIQVLKALYSQFKPLLRKVPFLVDDISPATEEPLKSD